MLFVVFLTAVMTVLSGTALLAKDLLYPGAVSFAGFTDLLLCLAPGAALSAISMLVVEGPVVKIL